MSYIDYQTHSKFAVHFGSGNIGRGFIGKILSESGYYVIFIDIQKDIINTLHNLHSYTIEIAHPPSTKHSSSKAQSYISSEVVHNVDGILSTAENTALINEAILHADIITSAVGPTVLPIIARSIAPALAHRFQHRKAPINIIACENKIRASELLQKEVMANLETLTTPDIQQEISNILGFPCCSVDRIVVATSTTDSSSSNSTQTQDNLVGNNSTTESNPLLGVRVEEYFEWNIDSTAFVALPNGEPAEKAIPQAKFTTNLDAYVERKLFTLNTGHTFLAYLGYLHNYSTIDKAMEDSKLSSLVLSAMKESSAALIAKWDFDEEEQNIYIEKLQNRFRNALLHDDVTRVARDPLRKIDAQDRFVNPITNCVQYNLPYTNLAFALATALHFDYEEDASAKALQHKISTLGVEAVLREICKITDTNVIEKVLSFYQKLASNSDYLLDIV